MVRGASIAAAIKQELQTVIRERGFTQRDLARTLGFGSAFLSNLFRPRKGRWVPLKVETLFALLEAMEVDPVAFLGGVYDQFRRAPLSAASAAKAKRRQAAADPGFAEPLTRGDLNRAAEAAAQPASVPGWKLPDLVAEAVGIVLQKQADGRRTRGSAGDR